MRISIENLNFAYDQDVVIRNLSLELASGSFLTVSGPNGCGKSTFIKCLLKLLNVPRGAIFLDDIDITRMRRLYNVGYVSQRTEFNFEFPITVCELLGAAYKKHKDAFFFELVNVLSLNTFFHKNVNNLSGGQIQRVFIARALLSNPRLLILDEPTLAVDSENISVLVRTLKKLKESGVTIVIVTHNLDFCQDLADYNLIMDVNHNYVIEKAGGGDAVLSR